MIDDNAIARQLASRLRAEGARDVEASGDRVSFRGVDRAGRADLSRTSPLVLVRDVTLTVHHGADGIAVTPTIRHNWRSPALIALGIGVLLPLLFIQPNGPRLLPVAGVVMIVVLGRFLVARRRIASWLNGLALQELSLLERRQIQPPGE